MSKFSTRKTVRPFAAVAAAAANSRRQMLETLETRTMMSVGPAAIANAGPNDTVYDADNNVLHVIYYDTTAKTLKHQGFNDDGTSTAATTIDNSGDTGQFLSMAQDANGVLHAAYYDVTNGDLKYARRDLAGTWSTSTIDSTNTVGLYPSVAIGADGQPAVSYYYKNNGNLKLAKFNGSAWNVSTISASNDVGRYSSLVLNPATNKFAVAFEDSTNGQYKYADENAAWAFQVVDDTQIGGGYISLAFTNNRPAMSYYDAHNADLKYAERSAAGTWSSVAVASKNSQGLYTDLAFTFDTNQPAIVYWNKTADTSVLAYRTPGGTWTFETLMNGGRNLTAVDGEDNGGAPELYLVGTDTTTGGLKVQTA
jgi:hypothetical protein